MREAEIYWHSRRRLWSVRVGRHVVDHVPAMSATRCRMIVREGERLRAIERRQRSVHAWIRGQIADPVTVDNTLGLVEIGYSYRLSPHFTMRPGFKPIFAARMVVFTATGQAYALP
jgi:hypothetical protein